MQSRHCVVNYFYNNCYCTQNQLYRIVILIIIVGTQMNGWKIRVAVVTRDLENDKLLCRLCKKTIKI